MKPAFTRGFRLHHNGRIIHGAEFPDGEVIVADDPLNGLGTAALSLKDLLKNYHHARVEWPPAGPPAVLQPADRGSTRAEWDSLGREADRLRKDWVEMRARAERVEAEVKKLRVDRAAVVLEVADFLRGLRATGTPATVQDIEAELREWAAALRRLATETQQPETQPDSCVHCGKNILRISGTLTKWWVHDPGGHTACFPQQGVSSPRATPKVVADPLVGEPRPDAYVYDPEGDAAQAAAGARQDDVWPVKESARSYAEELRATPGQASADGHTGWECEAGASLLVAASTPGPGALGTHHGTIYACAAHRGAAVERITGAGYDVDPKPAPPGHRWNPWPCGHVTAHDTDALTALTAAAGARQDGAQT